MSKNTQEHWPPFIDIAEPATPHPDSDGVVRLDFNDYSRARACVNACAGMTNPAAEIAELKRQRDELHTAEKLRESTLPIWTAYCEKKMQLEDAIKQRDELLAALEAAIECGIVPLSSAKEGVAAKYSRQVAVADKIRDAISKSKGGAA